MPPLPHFEHSRSTPTMEYAEGPIGRAPSLFTAVRQHVMKHLQPATKAQETEREIHVQTLSPPKSRNSARVLTFELHSPKRIECLRARAKDGGISACPMESLSDSVNCSKGLRSRFLIMGFTVTMMDLHDSGPNQHFD